ncbi:hypothetical protein [Nocardia sp. NPDC019302]|uniref:hypothetical protein n=1 Tax=Nocardia sp. NPDC019302 TaxID=3154592 RepID=UPI003401B744
MSDFLSLALIGTSGRRWDISGPNQGEQGAELMPKPRQFYDSPAVTYWIKSGGALQKYQGFSFKRRDPLFGLVICGDDPEEEAEIHSQLRMDLGMYDQTFQLEGTTSSGVRRLTMRLLEDPKAYETGDWEGKDPHLFGASTLMVSAAAEMPHWAGDPETSSWTLPAGTSGSTTTFLHPGNPGDVPIFPRWTLNGPGSWVIPDPSLGQEIDFQRPAGADTNRTYPVVALLPTEHVELDTNPDQPFMLTADGGLGPWMRSNGKELIYPVAPHTPPFMTTVSVSGATGGVTATIECDRWFSRPFGVSL